VDIIQMLDQAEIALIVRMQDLVIIVHIAQMEVKVDQDKDLVLIQIMEMDSILMVDMLVTALALRDHNNHI
jgi:hypothetical protein